MLNMVKLDVYDKRILEVLINNSREQISSISKKIKLRRENVNYRINRLIKSGLIQEFNTILNEKRLGLSHYVVFLELTNLQENTEQILLDYMEKNKYMFWIGPSAGRWSLIFDVIIPEDIELDKVIKGMMKKFSKYIDEYVILKLHEGNETYSFDEQSFNTMNYYEFVSDKYLSMYYTHHFDGFFLNHIPLMRKLKWREVVFGKGVIGDLGDKNKKYSSFPASLNELNKPFFEAGVGVENILKIIRIDAIWRLSHLNNPNINKFTIMFTLKFSL